MAITNAKYSMIPFSSGGAPVGAWDMYQVFKSEPIVSAGEVDSVFGTNYVDCPGMSLAQFGTFGFYSTSVGAAVDIEFKILQSYNNVAANFVIPDTDGSIVIVAGAGSHVDVVTPTPMPFIRFRCSGGAGNGAGTTVSAWIFLKSS